METADSAKRIGGCVRGPSWTRDGEWVFLKTAAPGREFVLDCDSCVETFDWLAEVLAAAPKVDHYDVLNSPT